MKEPSVGDASEVISNIINLSNISRKEGLLALEEATHDMDDEFLKKVSIWLLMVRIRILCVVFWKQI